MAIAEFRFAQGATDLGLLHPRDSGEKRKVSEPHIFSAEAVEGSHFILGKGCSGQSFPHIEVARGLA